MKKTILFCFTLSLIICSEKNEAKTLQEIGRVEKKEQTTLPFSTIELNDLASFKPTKGNWQIVGNAIADRTKEKNFTSTKGTGVLLNIPSTKIKNNLFTKFEHGDIELELDVMMPVGSNSGVYFQGRYEIQLFDSWGVAEPHYNDIGGIYQRWNNDAEKGKEGYEGHSPKMNAAKAPGLWQHLKVIFHAAKFDSNNKKIKNAWFEEVRLNDVLLHENVEVTGPTRAAAFGDEKALGPLMIQGDHGPVAFKNIKYKLYDGKTIGIGNTSLKIYDNSKGEAVIKNFEKFKLLEEIKTDSISPLLQIDPRDQKILSYKGTLTIPTSGEYLFEGTVDGGAYLIINKDTIVNSNEDVDMNSTKYGKVHLEKGQVTYSLVYNKPFAWRRGLDFFVQGPQMQRYSLLKTGSTSLSKSKPIKPITVAVTDKPLTQRSFLNFRGGERTHCISVGLVEKLNFSLDLATGSLLYVWSGDFLETTQMWHSRGEHQRGEPMGFSIASHGDLDFASLGSNNEAWPKALNEKNTFKPLGYELKNDGMPVFSFEMDGNEISDTFKATSNLKRGLDRIITANSKSSIWHKIAEGDNIQLLENNTYIINNESYYIVLKEGKPIIRNNNGKEELLVELPKGKSTIIYSIIW
ncbi:family 16 glycoside hydrolase [Flavobacterium ovatum]|uniref:family 16 glycoside hydrolase n=1 Tax=Flavobacterium ovatum TaxID=1928857 RepID=UPI00344E821E